MSWRNTAYLAASFITPPLALVFLVLFVLFEFRFAWVVLLLMIVAAEARVQVGERLARTKVFWTHLLSAVPFLLLLSVLAFFAQPLWLVFLTAAVGCATFATGSVLWYRGIRRVFQKNQ